MLCFVPYLEPGASKREQSQSKKENPPIFHPVASYIFVVYKYSVHDTSQNPQPAEEDWPARLSSSTVTEVEIVGTQGVDEKAK